MSNEPNKIMTSEEYNLLNIEGLHLVCKNYRGEKDCIAIWYIAMYPDEMNDRTGFVPTLIGKTCPH